MKPHALREAETVFAAPLAPNPQKAGGRILYLGSFLDEAIVAERGLRAHNAAGSNRMLRLSQALRRTGFRPILLSPATSLRAVRQGGPLIHPGRVRRHNGTAVVYAPAINILGLNMLTTLVFQVALLLRLMRRPVAGAVVYNFSPGLVVQTALLALRRGFRVINNIEDVSIPSLSDWRRKTEARPVQQLVFFACMALIARMSDAYLVPTKRFLSHLPRKTAAVITGCIEIPPTSADMPASPPIRVLYAGKIEREHGIVHFVEALAQLDATPEAGEFVADISGAGPMSDWVTKRIADIKTLRVTQHGFIAKHAYQQLLNQAHVCVALQDPKGRYAEFKTPSKIYEFLGYGKAVIATDVGDIGEIPDAALCRLKTLSAKEIGDQLMAFASNPQTLPALQSAARHHATATYALEQVGTRLHQIFLGKAA